MDGVPQRFQGVSRETWAEVLDAAAGAGLLTGLGGGMYRIHPALPAYLAARWRTEEGAGYDDQRAAATRALLSAYAAFGGWLLQQIEFRRRRARLHRHRPAAAHHGSPARLRAGQAALGRGASTSPSRLPATGTSRGLYAEAAAWTDRVRLATEDADGVPPELDSAAGDLWLFFVGAQAQRQMDSGRLDAAERTYREILAMLQAQPASPQQQGNLAVIYHQLGMVAQDRGRLDEAADWYARSLAISEELGDRPGMAASYHQLGMVAQDRGRLDEAADWYARSLAIKEELGDRPGMAAATTSSAWSRRTGGGWMRPRTGTPGPWPSRRSSATGPGWRPATTSSAWSRRTGGGWMRPRTGTPGPWPSARSSATGRHGGQLPPARHRRAGPGAAG